MSTITASSADGEAAETITDIQNYLQSFNKEIGESSGNDANQTVASNSSTAYYTIDASQVIDNDESNVQDSASVSDNLNNAVGNNDNGNQSFQTVAILPDSANGGYVLIVQPTAQGQVQIPVTESMNVDAKAVETISADDISNLNNGETNMTLGDVENEEPVSNRKEKRTTLTRIKKEKPEEKPNDISVYDFDDVNPPPAQEMEEDTVDEEIEGNDADELEQEDINESKSNLTTPKLKRSANANRKSLNNTAKKAKLSTPTTPSTSNQHMCNYCSYTSSKRYLLSRHMKSHSEERPHKCGICERGFKTIASLQNHVNTHTGVRPHGCKYCDAAFTTSGELVRHVRYRHTHEKPHRCTECDYASVELSKLKRHMRCHTGERPYQCPHCTYASPDTYKLKRHLRIHTGEKPYECDVCNARFTQSNSLKAHRLIHSGNKPIFKCELCPTTCGRKTDLRIHVQKLHTSDKPLTCKRCDQSFPDRYSFKIHIKSHEGEKCFKCDLCNYASVSSRHLESHMLIHTDQKPFQCDDCDQSFRQKQLLKRHRNLYHNPEYIPPQPKEKTHECPNCNKAFRHKGNLMRHLVCHDPDAYKDMDQSSRMNDTHQLIDDEESDENSQMILPNAESESDNHTLQFTLDPQTQQILQGEQVVVFEVVQLNNADNSTDNDTRGSFSTTAIDPTLLESTPLTSKIHKSIKGLRTATFRNATVLSTNNTAASDNIVIQLHEDEEAANTIQNDNVIDEPDYIPMSKMLPSMLSTTTTSVTSAPPPPPVVYDETKNLRDQMQKQKDIAECFGFKDDDEEDDAILSMPAAHAQ